MTDDTNTADSGAGPVAPAETPKITNDAQAAQIEAQAPQDPKPAEDAAKADEDKKGEEKTRNRTRDYINRLNADLAAERQRAAEAAREVERLRQQVQPQRATADPAYSGPPRLEDYEWDTDRWSRAQADYVRQEITKEHQQVEAQRQQQTLVDTYLQRVDAFAEQHPDFQVAVGSIDQRLLTPELQRAVMAHDNGPQIAYHLANDDEALFNIASIRPELQAAAVERLAARLSAAPPPPVSPPANALAAIAPTKPISQAPPPPPRVGGRAVAETPAEKLTDDDWYRADREKRRRR